MVELGREIVRALVEVHGPAETVRRFSDPVLADRSSLCPRV
jgi:hypothetical protein